ncbi:hypothetical protein CVT24_004925 [Panaeolus cyanescens]|uniref:CBM1 domain-containing protein n=1 Tax=Panaeolus cyanescens TaxID=181874 RepID=A0A409VD42_9AGAR|nr:hypothetical protein CVT24_004925 [Panaeolus cyanescens]
MNINNDLPSMSTCTSCSFSEDFSNYWTAVLYFKHHNGTYKRVPQAAGQFTGNANGGMTIYYIQQGNSRNTAFKKARDAMSRSFSGSQEARSLNFRCLGANGSNGDVIGLPGTDTNTLPTQPCLGGIRSQIIFPSCWNGVDLDTPNHKSHMAYPSANGACPSTHPVVVPQLFIETIWDTTKFNSMWPSGAPQPFVFSMGDPVGVGQHADYVFGWQGDSLQRAMDQCNDFGGNCPTLRTQSEAQFNRCTKKTKIPEEYEGWLPALPGCNPIQAGPAAATPVSGCGAPTTWVGDLPAGPTQAPGNPTTTIVNPVPTTVAPGPMQTQWGQCGGIGYNGPTQCVSPYVCRKQNDYYSQCLA